MEKQGTEVIYLRGNHDDILERFLPVCFGNLRIVDEYIHETPAGNYLVVHGDGFDRVTTSHRWVAIAGQLATVLGVQFGLGMELPLNALLTAIVASAVLNLALNLLCEAQGWWAMLPIAGDSVGWALMVPVVTLMVLDLVPERRGMASSLQAFIGSSANGLVAGLIAPLVMHSTVALATASLLMMGVGVLAWIWVKPRLET
jgi:hypothetical protein